MINKTFILFYEIIFGVELTVRISVFTSTHNSSCRDFLGCISVIHSFVAIIQAQWHKTFVIAPKSIGQWSGSTYLGDLISVSAGR